MSVTDWNVGEVPAMIDLAGKLGAKVLNFFFLVRTGRGRDLTDIDADAYERILTYLASIQGGDGRVGRGTGGQLLCRRTHSAGAVPRPPTDLARAGFE